MDQIKIHTKIPLEPFPTLAVPYNLAYALKCKGILLKFEWNWSRLGLAVQAISAVMLDEEIRKLEVNP